MSNLHDISQIITYCMIPKWSCAARGVNAKAEKVCLLPQKAKGCAFKHHVLLIANSAVVLRTSSVSLIVWSTPAKRPIAIGHPRLNAKSAGAHEKQEAVNTSPKRHKALFECACRICSTCPQPAKRKAHTVPQNQLYANMLLIS